jgi:hypothetical protein
MDKNINNNMNKNMDKSQVLITKFFKPKELNKEPVKGYNSLTSHYHCLECGVDMGDYPGQLCRKSFCDTYNL